MIKYVRPDRPRFVCIYKGILYIVILLKAITGIFLKIQNYFCSKYKIMKLLVQNNIFEKKL